MKKKNKLQYEVDFDFLMWGINTVLPIYKLCWLLNNCFSFDLARSEDIENPSQIKGKQYFRYYTFTDEVNMFSIEIIDNKSENGPFINELKHVDFLFLVKGELDFFDSAVFTKMLGQIRGVESVLPINANQLKSKLNLVFE